MITGAAGFLGSHLACALRASGAELILIDNLCVQPLQPPPVELVARSVQSLTYEDFDGVDVIYHLAAWRSVPESHFLPDRYAENVIAGRHLLDLAIEAQVSRIILASSCEVYGEAAVIPTPESAGVKPLSPYAQSKAELERYATSLDSGRSKIVTARLFNVYGPGHRPDTVIANFCARALCGEALVIDGPGTQRRDLSFVGDTIVKLIELLKAAQTTTVNVGSGCSYSVLDIAQSLRRLIPAISWTHGPARRNEIQEFKADTSYFDGSFNCVSATGIDTGIASTLGWWRSKALGATMEGDLSCK